MRPHLPFNAPQKYWDLHDPARFPLPANASVPRGAPSFAPTTWGELRQYQGIPKEGPLDDATTRRLLHGYYAAASYMDAQMGRVLDELDRLKLTDNTIVVLWGDHGWHLGDHGMWCKHTNYEQATRAPLFCAAPGQPGGQRVKDIVEFVDIYPTLCDLAGLERPGHLQGDSLAELVRGRPAPKTQPQTDNLALHVYPRANKETARCWGRHCGAIVGGMWNGSKKTERSQPGSCTTWRTIRRNGQPGGGSPAGGSHLAARGPVSGPIGQAGSGRGAREVVGRFWWALCRADV